MQRPNESVEDYGKELLRIAKGMFSLDDVTINDQLKTLFARGLRDEQLRVISFDKIGKEKSKGKDIFWCQELVEYVKKKEESRLNSAESRSAIGSAENGNAGKQRFHHVTFSASSGSETGTVKNQSSQLQQYNPKEGNDRYYPRPQYKSNNYNNNYQQQQSSRPYQSQSYVRNWPCRK